MLDALSRAFGLTRPRAGLLPLVVLVAGVVAAVATDVAPPSAPMLAALVAATIMGVAATAWYSAAGAAASLLIALWADDLRRSELAGQALLVAVIGMLAIAVARYAWNTDHAGGDAMSEGTLAAALMHARTAAEVGKIAIEQAQRLYGARLARLAVRGERDVFEYVGDSLPPAVHDEHRLFSLHGDDPAAVAMRGGRSAYWPTFSEFSRRHRRAAQILSFDDVGSVAFLPLVGEGQAIGVWVVAFAVDRGFTRPRRVDLEHAAAQIALALDRARLFEFERSVAATLQHSLLGPPVLIEGAGHCARYLPAVSTLSVGGDWYDTIPLPDRRVGVAVGDAVGRGLEAATVMGQLRSALGAAALRSSSAADTVDCLDEFALNLPAAASTTVAYAVVDLENESVEYCSAGHPPPLYVAADGSAEFLEDAQNWPLGLGIERARRSAVRKMDPGSLLVMYSDGLIERRRQSLDVGLERLVKEAQKRVRLPIDRLADELLEVMLSDSDGSDDVVLLLFRSPVSSPQMLLRKIPATSEGLGRVRRDVREWLESVEFTTDRAVNLLIAVGEACMNVVQHAYTDETHRLLRVEGAVADDEIMVTVTDTGTWKEQSSRSVGGRGITLMRTLVPTVEFNRRRSGTSVTFRMQMGRSDDSPTDD